MTTNERNGNITPQNEKTWNDMHQSLDEDAWRQLSREFPWSEQVARKVPGQGRLESGVQEQQYVLDRIDAGKVQTLY